ncbi:hypothetical protein BRAO375_560013 [Bradyrhizobium sp. ORS 375]|nr:hypothetical protein BRAO375_560013 [Bradyrhizobium sp. ORS 375]
MFAADAFADRRRSQLPTVPAPALHDGSGRSAVGVAHLPWAWRAHGARRSTVVPANAGTHNHRIS